MRLAMLTGQKHMALVNNYSKLDLTLDNLQKQTAIDVFNHISKQNHDNKSFDEIKQKLKIPPELKVLENKNWLIDYKSNFKKVYSFDTGETRRFKTPSRDPSDSNATQSKDNILLEYL